MNCDDFKKLIPLYLEGLLDNYQLDEFVDHFVDCRACELEALVRATEVNV